MPMDIAMHMHIMFIIALWVEIMDELLSNGLLTSMALHYTTVFWKSQHLLP